MLSIVALCCAGCSHNQTLTDSPGEVIGDAPATGGELPVISAEAATEHAELVSRGRKDSYTLAYGDVIEIKFFYNPEFDDIVAVRPDGKISLSPLGDLSVRDRDCEEVADEIEEKMSAYLRNPAVSVIVRQFNLPRVYVLGEVGNPGGFSYQMDMNLLQVLSEAGGLLKTAKTSSVMIVRISTRGEPFAIRADISKVLKEDSFQNNVQILPNDIVYVPDTFIAKVDTFVEQYFADLLPALQFYLYGYGVLHPDRYFQRR